MERAWKYTFGTYTFYGLLFLAYGAFACFALNLRYFSAGTSGLLGIGVGLIFTVTMTLWMVAFCRYSVWFGSFKNKFYIFDISKYYYALSSLERVITAFVIVCLSPGLIASAAVCVIFISEAILLSVKKLYGLEGFKRPLFNKIITVMICLLYVGAALTSADSTINQFIPLIILALLFAVIVVAIVASVQELKDRCKALI